MPDAPLEFSLLVDSGIPTKSFIADEVVFREGEKADELYVIQHGTVEIHGGQRVLAILEAGDFFGEMALIDQAPRSATAIAKTDVELIPISEKRFIELVTKTPEFSLDLLRILVKRLRARDGLY